MESPLTPNQMGPARLRYKPATISSRNATPQGQLGTVDLQPPTLLRRSSKAFELSHYPSACPPRDSANWPLLKDQTAFTRLAGLSKPDPPSSLLSLWLTPPPTVPVLLTTSRHRTAAFSRQLLEARQPVTQQHPFRVGVLTRDQHFRIRASSSLSAIRRALFSRLCR